jgi:uncharacterized protein
MRFLLLFLLCCSSSFAAIDVETIFGVCHIDDPMIEELIQDTAMQRLKKIDQSGIPYYFGFVGAFDRFSHSVGVFHLLQKFSSSYEEQVAGLLHDTSHTVFSHLGDYIFKTDHRGDAYQDGIHSWFLSQSGCFEIFDKYKISRNRVANKAVFKALEQNLPTMCADRIEYNLHTGLVFDLLSKKQVKEIYEDLHFENNDWFFTDKKLAKTFAMLSVYFTEKFWSDWWNCIIQEKYAEAVNIAIASGLITIDDIHFGTDIKVFNKILYAKDRRIQDILRQCWHILDDYEVTDSCEHDYYFVQKFRGIDPFVLHEEKLVRLTSLDTEFKQEYLRVKNVIKKGIRIKKINKAKGLSFQE